MTADSQTLADRLFGPATTAPTFSTPSVIWAMLDSGKGISDLILSPGRPLQVEQHGELSPVEIRGLDMLRGADTARLARDIIGDNRTALQALQEQGACDLSYSLPEKARFRVNIFRQRGSYAIVMRVIASRIPTLGELKLPASLIEIASLKNGIVLVTGPTGSGKSTTLAAIIDLINETRADHILTIEDPIEFLHHHKKATVHQRELHSDTPTFSLSLRAALRQAPKVILVGEMRDRETIEIAIEASETGHLVMSTLHTIDASKTVERIIGTFPLGEQPAMRTRFSKVFQYIISQRLLPRQDGKGRVAILEVLKGTLRTRGYVEQGEADGKTLLDAMKVGGDEGMQHFDGEIEKLIRAGLISTDTGINYATNSNNLRLNISDVLEEQRQAEKIAAATTG